MNTKKLERLPSVAAAVLMVLVVAACAIQLRGDEDQAKSAASADQASSDPLATKLAECRSVTYEQNDALSECKKTWAEKRRQFLGQKASSDNGTPQKGFSLFVPPKGESRLSPAYPPIQQTGKE